MLGYFLHRSFLLNQLLTSSLLLCRCGTLRCRTSSPPPAHEFSNHHPRLALGLKSCCLAHSLAFPQTKVESAHGQRNNALRERNGMEYEHSPVFFFETTFCSCQNLLVSIRFRLQRVHRFVEMSQSVEDKFYFRLAD
ncbi:uncharacterized protein J3R85_018481 [Psidium guajava]|nr:uncharacterized protein J3R85_018481 [Psidium guajava]